MDVANELLDAIEIIVDKKMRDSITQIYSGVCKSINTNNCVMSINGKDNIVQYYGSAPSVDSIYRVFVPNGNMSMAFIITGGGESGGSSSGVGDMLKSVYDPKGKAQDIFTYVDNSINSAIVAVLEASY